MDSNVVVMSSSSSLSCETKVLNGLMNHNINGDDRSESDSFILDIHSFDTPNSRFTKSLSRKGFEKKTSSNGKDALVTTTCSPRGGNSSPGVDNHPQAHQITITTNGSINAESKWGLRRNSFRRSLGFDPRRIVFFFATLSSMGTMILIYFTLISMRKDDATLN